MCWNATVSIQTFLLTAASSYVLYLLGSDLRILLAIMSFYIMQLVEYFLWTYRNQPRLNNLFSLAGLLVLVLQPVAAIGLVNRPSLQKTLYLLYAGLVAFYVMVRYGIMGATFSDSYTTVSPTGHLVWNWTPVNDSMYTYPIYFGIVLYSLYHSEYAIYGLGLLLSYVAAYLLFHKENSVESMWCWSVSIGYLFVFLYIYVQHLHREKR